MFLPLVTIEGAGPLHVTRSPNTEGTAPTHQTNERRSVRSSCITKEISITSITPNRRLGNAVLYTTCESTTRSSDSDPEHPPSTRLFVYSSLFKAFLAFSLSSVRAGLLRTESCPGPSSNQPLNPSLSSHATVKAPQRPRTATSTFCQTKIITVPLLKHSQHPIF